MNAPEELARFKEEARQRTRLVLEKVTPDQLDWMPAPQALTIRQMVRHMRLSEEGSFQAQISTYLRLLGEQWPSPYGKLP
jgi:glucose-6-phosphate-specific signal transduction histidine kinase